MTIVAVANITRVLDHDVPGTFGLSMRVASVLTQNFSDTNITDIPADASEATIRALCEAEALRTVQVDLEQGLNEGDSARLIGAVGEP